MPSVLTVHLQTLLGSLLECRLDGLKEITQAARVGLMLYRMDKESFPFFDERSSFYIGVKEKGAREPQFVEDYRRENREQWLKILSVLKKIDLDDWPSALDDFQTEHLEQFLEGKEVSVEYFAVLFIYFLSKVCPLVFKRLQIKYPEAVVAVMSSTLADGPSGKKQKTRSPLQSSPPQTQFLPPHLQQSPEQILNQFKKKEYSVTDSSIQNLVKFITELQNEIQIIREELIFKEKENFELQDKLSQTKTEKKQLKEELDNQLSIVGRLNFKISTMQNAMDQQSDSPSKISLEIAYRKIDDLHHEIDLLQKKNSDLEYKLQSMAYSKQTNILPRQSMEEESERIKDRIRCLQLENKVLEDKISVLEGNGNTLSDKLLREKDNYFKISSQLSEVYKQLTQKELALKSAHNDKDALLRDNERLKDTIVEREHQLRRLETEFSSIVNHSQPLAYSSNPQLVASRNAAEDSNLELIKICKEVNRNYLKELNCVYGLLHDTFVSELTGTTLDELIKKRLAEQQRPHDLFQ
jgi:predicted nuclease with TOPRIM domain